MAAPLRRHGAFLDAGAEVFDYGNYLRAEAEHGGFERAFAYPGFIRHTSGRCSARARPVPWAALSGDPADIAATDTAVLEEFPENEALARWIRMAGERVPSRACPRGSAGSGTASVTGSGCGSTTWSRAASFSADRDRPGPPRLRVASRRRTRDRSMADGSDAIADWPLLERAGEHRERRLVGQHPPRRRRRDRPLDPRGPSGRRRRPEIAGGRPSVC
jgi:urocanate hydratase